MVDRADMLLILHCAMRCAHKKPRVEAGQVGEIVRGLGMICEISAAPLLYVYVHTFTLLIHPAIFDCYGAGVAMPIICELRLDTLYAWV